MSSLNRLTAITAKSIKTPGWHADGGGIYLEVGETGTRRWILRIAAGGQALDSKTAL